MSALSEIFVPAIRQFKPELNIVASGYDANAYDPLARILLYSDTYRQMTKLVRDIAEELCDNKLVLVHEGGYSEFYVPFCGLVTI
ncbi:hypothetical protein MEG_01909 [Bartonella tamiae Th307]|uniref:Histone deacetylase domain-containing protein n=1 Tax=Bartonella tamiae Th239 TaxID=1094558 RepID=J0QU42_9HYPH|nr:hypothetical protein ME5_01947 [Bartonella tamiae Th239]EJF92739.1 hypothetical protein MEG_01909 [Bartonella tamiae Th307]